MSGQVSSRNVRPQAIGYLVLASAVFLSAFLLFQVQPLMTKFILPWFGGSPAVWTTAMLFFQCVLFFGYAYAHASQRWLGPFAAAMTHLVLLVAAGLMLPIIPGVEWKPIDSFRPEFRMLGLLAFTVGLPYFVLSSTGPLLQAWFGRLFPGKSPYRLYSLSNIGSLLALLSYPTLFEPNWSITAQATTWSAGFIVFAILCATTTWWTRHTPTFHQWSDSVSKVRPQWWHYVLWIALPAAASVMLLATTNEVCQNVAPMPFLWVVPLALYLLSFIICFDHPRWYRPVPTSIATALLIILTAGIGEIPDWFGLEIGTAAELTIYFGALFGVCLICHGETVLLRPSPAYLTEFYLMMSAGGAMGGLLVSLVAPHVFTTFMEFPLALFASLGIAVIVTAIGIMSLSGSLKPSPFRILGSVLFSILGGCLVWSVSFMNDELLTFGDAKFRSRNFYGTISVFENVTDDSAMPYRVFKSGHIHHGRQFLDLEKRKIPVAYYGAGSGPAKAMDHLKPRGPMRVGIVGLGVATIAAYARPGDHYRFYEINPQVEEVARKEFHYLADCQGECDVALGDARLLMEREEPQGYDLLVLDAFTADAPPVHLLTVEAFEIYRRHLKPDGILAVNATNTYIDLPPVVEAVGAAVGWKSTRVTTSSDSEQLIYRTDYVVLTRDQSFLDLHPSMVPASKSMQPTTPVWTDSFSNLFKVLIVE